jgi:hypothetical protein
VVVIGNFQSDRDAADNQVLTAAGANRFTSPAGAPVCSSAFTL